MTYKDEIGAPANCIRTVLTAGVLNQTLAGSENYSAEAYKFSKFVDESLKRFMNKDWGNCDDSDNQLNNEAIEALESGEYGRPLASYISKDWSIPRIWITQEIVGELGEQTITVLFPSEY